MWKEKIKKALLKTEKKQTNFPTEKNDRSSGFQPLFHKNFSYDYYYEKIR